MAENTAIEWCDHTFNPWVGCAKVSPACDHCYAEGWAKRGGKAAGVVWGGERRRTGADTWGKPEKWQKRAAEFLAQHGRRQRVFCASLADVFDNQVPSEWRDDLWQLIEATPDLDWLLLTKRVGNVPNMLALPFDFARNFPHVWIGATVCNQEEADRDIPKLLEVDARVRFLSIEPMLGPISFEGMFANPKRINDGTNALEELDWVICGGESGPGARPMHPDWARDLRDQCAAAGVPFLFKQWGEWGPYDRSRNDGASLATPNALDEPMQRFGKKAAGRLIDGIEHNGFPEVAAC